MKRPRDGPWTADDAPRELGRIPEYAKRDRPAPDAAAYTDAGLLLDVPRAVRPVSQVFSGFALLRVLAGHRRRVRREMAALPPADLAELKPLKPLKSRRRSRLQTIEERTSPLPGGRAWGSLRVGQCAGCRAILLGAADEHLRAAYRPHFAAAELPPPIAGRDGRGLPLCETCHAEELR